MKIAFDHQIFGWQEYGGISRYAYEVAVRLATSFQQEVAVISPLYVNRYLNAAPPELRVLGVSVPKVRKTGRIYRAVNSVIARPVMKYFRPDIVHETYYSSSRIAPKTARVVLTVHDMIHEKFPESFSRLDPASREKALAVERADHVICVSEQTRKDLIELLSISPGKTSVIHHGFTLTEGVEGRAEEDAPLVRPYLLYVGNRGGYKNFAGLLKAFVASSWMPKELDIICFGGESFTTGEIGLIQSYGLKPEHVRQVSGSDATLAFLYRNARAFVYPSWYEGFGIPPLEAMNFDCPVVCSGLSSIPEVVGNAGEMFDPYEIDSMRHAIERVVSDDALRQSLIARGKERIKLFSWQRCARETLTVYQKALS